jgi:hypothetical protein
MSRTFERKNHFQDQPSIFYNVIFRLQVYLWEAGLLVDMVDIKQSYITRAMWLEEDDHVVRTGLYTKLWFPVRLVVRTRFTDK